MLQAVSVQGPPGPGETSAVQLWRFNRDFLGFMEDCVARYGDTFTIRPFPYDRFVVATAPADVEAVLTDRERFAGGDAAGLIEPVVGRYSVILASGQTHMRQRKRLLAPFHGEHVAKWAQRIEALAADELDALPVGRPVQLRPVMQRITFSVICHIVFGLTDPARIERFQRAVARMMDPRLSALLFFPSLLRRRGPLNPARPFLTRRDAVDALIGRLIAERRADPGHKDRDDVLSLLMAARHEDGTALSDRELRDELMGLLIAGHETTATGLAWAAERLARNPAAQQRLAAELDSADKPVYLDAVIQETLRLRPPVIDAVRTTVTETELGGHRIARDTIVSAMFTVTHRRADVWPEPLAFKPERFLDGRPAPYSYTPFGGGIRRCVGATLANFEMRIVLTALLRRFRLEAASSRDEAIRLAGITLIPARGATVILEPGQAGLGSDARRDPSRRSEAPIRR
jgi:cytochrome P450